MHIRKIHRKRKGTVYKVQVKHNGMTKTKTFSRKIDAVNWGQMTEIALSQNMRLNMTFGELAEEWLKNHSKVRNAPRTYLDYKAKLCHIDPILGSKKIEDISYGSIENVIPALLRNNQKKNVSINRYLTLLRTIFNYAIRKGYLLISPVKKEHFLKESEVSFQYWTQEEANSFLDYASQKYLNKHQHVLLVYILALNTGMRWGEIVALKWDAIKLHGSKPYLIVKRSYCTRSHQMRETTKGSYVRYIGINEVLFRELIKAYDSRSSETDLVVFSENNTVLDNQNFLKRHWYPDLIQSKVSKIRFHDMRHTYASNFMMNGGNLFDLQKILGHQDIKTTQRYAHLAKDYILDKANIVVLGNRENVISVNFEKSKMSDAGS